MANVKITDLVAYTDPVSTDVLAVVDIGADITKKVSIADLLENAGSGTAAAPGIAFDGDSNTGIYRPGADQVAISTNGTGRLFVDSSGFVGMGTATPQSELTVRGSTPRITLEPTADTQNCRIQFALTDGTVQSQITGGGSFGSAIRFSQGPTERARIDSSGRLLVGTSSASVDARVVLQAHSGSSTQDGKLYIQRGATSLGNNTRTGQINFADSASNVGAAIESWTDDAWASGDYPSRLVFSTTADGSSSPTEAMRIKNDGTINFSNVAVYADNAAAKTGGLVDGDVYRTSTGDLKIVYT
jgi:hypothetical protein